MAKVICMCGKICSGKTSYSQKLRKQLPAVTLSVDEITLALFEQHIGDKHDEVVAKAEKYLYDKSLELIEIGVNVILDWGFWQKSEREFARSFYGARNIQCEFHYVDISESDWQRNIAERNRKVQSGEISAYYVDEGLAEKFSRLFERPDESEIDVLCNNN